MKTYLSAAFLAAGLMSTGHALAAVIHGVEVFGESFTFDTGAFSTQNGFAGTTALAGRIQLTSDNGSVTDARCVDRFHAINLGARQDLKVVRA